MKIFLPGVNNEVFWSSFWPSLYSGIITGIITGIIVGLFIWGVQKHINTNSYKKQLEREFLLFKEDLRYIINKEDNVSFYSAVGSCPIVAEEVIKNIKGKPLELWKSNLKKHEIILMKIFDIRSAYLKFVIIAEKLDYRLKELIRLYNHDKGIDSINDETNIAYSIGKFYDFSSENILPWIDMENKDSVVNRFNKCHEAVEVDDIVKKYVGNLHEIRKLLLEDIEEVKNIIKD